MTIHRALQRVDGLWRRKNRRSETLRVLERQTNHFRLSNRALRSFTSGRHDKVRHRAPLHLGSPPYRGVHI
ncbi:hypothetical protein AQ862_06900 [Burkholderia pseudomallei]|nr:hypothetical protein AQ862_06900 [Burkholderia pseudomallei]